MERGIVMPTVARLVELAGIFSCDAADLLTEAGSRTSNQGTYVGQLLAKARLLCTTTSGAISGIVAYADSCHSAVAVVTGLLRRAEHATMANAAVETSEISSTTHSTGA